MEGGYTKADRCEDEATATVAAKMQQQQQQQQQMKRSWQPVCAVGSVMIMLGLVGGFLLGFRLGGTVYGGSPMLAEKHSLVMCADDGAYVDGFGESKLLRELAADVSPDPLREALLCTSVHRAVFYGEPALLVTTGIGDTKAALCLESILREYGPMISEVIFLGTAGGSAAVGGVIDSDDCDSDETRKADELAPRVVGLGDVCVSPFATTFDCHRCFWSASHSDGGPRGAAAENKLHRALSACARAPCTLHDRPDIFGTCSWFAETSLADEIIRAAQASELPRRSTGIRNFEARYWKEMGRASPRWAEAHSLRGDRGVVRGYDACAEATSLTYWNGAPFDEIARDYIAQLINQAHDALGLAHETNATRRDVLAISAMEGTGWMSALKLTSQLRVDDYHIPAANIRGVADYTHEPLYRRASDGEWIEDGGWVTPDERANATENGYIEAIRTTSSVVTSLFQRRAERRKKQ